MKSYTHFNIFSWILWLLLYLYSVFAVFKGLPEMQKKHKA